MSTAADFKKHRKPKTVTVTVVIDGAELSIECRRPDLAHMVMSGLMTWPALQRVREIMQAQAAANDAILDNRPMPTLVDRAQAVGAMLDEWVCMAAVSPRIVLYEHEESEDSIWIDGLSYGVKEAIFNATFSLTERAVSSFRRDEPSSPAPGQSGEAVRPETVDVVGAHG